MKCSSTLVSYWQTRDSRTGWSRKTGNADATNSLARRTSSVVTMRSPVSGSNGTLSNVVATLKPRPSMLGKP